MSNNMSYLPGYKITFFCMLLYQGFLCQKLKGTSHNSWKHHKYRYYTPFYTEGYASVTEQTEHQ